MSLLFNFFTNYFKTDIQEVTNTLVLNSKFHVNDNTEDEYSVLEKKFLISSEDLEKINLRSSEDIIPNPSRNMPLLDKVSLQNLNKAQLNIILSVKLKPIPQIEKQKIYEPRHPVLKEILQKTAMIN